MDSGKNIFKAIILLLLVCSFQSKSQMCYNVSGIPYNPDPFNAGTNINMNVDDGFSAAINMPFQFCFDGVFYNQLIISSNGYVSFNVGLAGGYSPWPIVGPIPTNNPAEITNSILGPWEDLDPTVTGNIFYNTYGIAPNRRFVVSYNNVALFSCNGKKLFAEMIMYETNFTIELVINLKESCNVGNMWNNNWAIQGVNNAAGSIAFPVPGRNATSWTAANDAWHFVNCGPCVVLPIELASLSVDVRKDFNQISWTTASERDNDYFIIEKSKDAVTFTEIGKVKGAGTTHVKNTYVYNDSRFENGTNYYRLQSVDLSGKKTISAVHAVENNISNRVPVKYLNVLGYEVSENEAGIVLVVYSDGSVIKKVN